jgi:hypothetical protein
MSAELETGSILDSIRAPAVGRATPARSWIWKWYRRELVGRVRRATRWEFWPPWAFYPPVLMYLFYLGLKHKKLTLFTAVNPAIPDGGFIGESKYEILRALERSSSVPKMILVKPDALDERAASIENFMRREGLTFPIVLKPDAGQRGSGVSIIRSSDDIRHYLAGGTCAVIAQEYVGGLEFGVFYYRVPGDETGHIFSITEKQMPVVVGNGMRTLEELILADDRAVCLANLYCRQNSGLANTLLAKRERVQLVELGTHCRGAIFLDGRFAITPALEKTIDEIASTFDGFYFGRFDIRVPSVEDLKAGRSLKILELNGVTSEATNIYDPKTRLLDAYEVLFRQWRIAFEIGERNIAKGARPTSLRQLLRAVLKYRQTSKGHNWQRSRELDRSWRRTTKSSSALAITKPAPPRKGSPRTRFTISPTT